MSLATIEAALDLHAAVRALPVVPLESPPTFLINASVRHSDIVYLETTQRPDSRAFIIRLSTLLEFDAHDNIQVC